MVYLFILLLAISIMVSIFVTITAYITGSDHRERETRWPSLYSEDEYNNTYIVPFNYVYDAGYAAHDKRKQRAERNKEHFKNKEDK